MVTGTRNRGSRLWLRRCGASCGGVSSPPTCRRRHDASGADAVLHLVDSIDSAVAAVASAGELDRRTIAESASGRFTAAAMIDKYIEVYRDVINNRK